MNKIETSYTLHLWPYITWYRNSTQIWRFHLPRPSIGHHFVEYHLMNIPFLSNCLDLVSRIVSILSIALSIKCLNLVDIIVSILSMELSRSCRSNSSWSSQSNCLDRIGISISSCLTHLLETYQPAHQRATFKWITLTNTPKLKNLSWNSKQVNLIFKGYW